MVLEDRLGLALMRGNHFRRSVSSALDHGFERHPWVFAAAAAALISFPFPFSASEYLCEANGSKYGSIMPFYRDLVGVGVHMRYWSVISDVEVICLCYSCVPEHFRPRLAAERSVNDHIVDHLISMWIVGVEVQLIRFKIYKSRSSLLPLLHAFSQLKLPNSELSKPFSRLLDLEMIGPVAPIWFQWPPDSIDDHLSPRMLTNKICNVVDVPLEAHPHLRVTFPVMP
mmetsp:Transcript_33693/g.54251  ORF Transcript_33693/g.54251 Transcript_33693/m.54251 type:complete len:227 (-) Transcript_33693:211-891(-)